MNVARWGQSDKIGRFSVEEQTIIIRVSLGGQIVRDFIVGGKD